MDPLRSCIALGPLAMYLFVLAIINLSRRPLLTTGGRDITALAVGVAGFVAAGPMELFIPEMTLDIFRSRNIGWLFWLLLPILYGLCVCLYILTARPRLVIYNLPRRHLRPILEQVAGELDGQARWAGDSLLLPNLGVNLTLELYGLMRCVQLVSAGPSQDLDGWHRLTTALSRRLRDTKTALNTGGLSQLFFAVMITMLISYWIGFGQQEMYQALLELFRV